MVTHASFCLCISTCVYYLSVLYLNFTKFNLTKIIKEEGKKFLYMLNLVIEYSAVIYVNKYCTIIKGQILRVKHNEVISQEKSDSTLSRIT